MAEMMAVMWVLTRVEKTVAMTASMMAALMAEMMAALMVEMMAAL